MVYQGVHQNWQFGQVAGGIFSGIKFTQELAAVQKTVANLTIIYGELK
jgi:hypothetical protein